MSGLFATTEQRKAVEDELRAELAEQRMAIETLWRIVTTHTADTTMHVKRRRKKAETP